MEKWLKEVILETDNVKLLPINEIHKTDLLTASFDGNLSELWFTSVPTENSIDIYIKRAIEDFKLDKGLAFVVVDKKTNQIIGTTRYTNATP
jgi:RimJ/RimL family protein N-acetyltransferase